MSTFIFVVSVTAAVYLTVRILRTGAQMDAEQRDDRERS